MFGLSRKRNSETVVPFPAALPREATPAEPVAEAPHADLLRQWMSLAQTQQRVIRALVSEVARSSSFVETEADALSSRFQTLAVSARQQTARVDSLTNLATGIELDGKIVPIHECTALLSDTLNQIVGKILLLSKDSMTLVFALDELGENVQRVETCITAINEINSTLNMLALNARIEAERAGAAGAGFRVVANEVREMSKATRSLAEAMNRDLKTIADGVNAGRTTIKRVATVDMSDNMLVQDRIETLLAALVRRNDRIGQIVGDAVRESGLISTDVAAMVTGIQFQDRTKQRLEHVVDTLNVIDQAIEEIRRETNAAVHGLDGEPGANAEWLKRLLAGFTMSEMREEFVARILGVTAAEWPGGMPDTNVPSQSGTAELF